MDAKEEGGEILGNVGKISEIVKIKAKKKEALKREASFSVSSVLSDRCADQFDQ